MTTPPTPPGEGLRGKRFVTPSGRHWTVGDRPRWGRWPLHPVGAGIRGGVKTVYVDPERLDGTDKIWRPL